MDGMLSLLGEHKSCILFEQLFLERLAEDIRLLVVHAKFDEPRELARRADALWSSCHMSESFTALTLQKTPPFTLRHCCVI